MPESTLVVATAAGFAAGLAIGGALFVSLRWNGLLFAQGRAFAACGAQLLRMLLAALALVALARSGAVLLLAAMVGILAARACVLRATLRVGR